MIAEHNYNIDSDGNLVEASDPASRYVFCGAGSTVQDERAEKLQAYLDGKDAKIKAEAAKAAKAASDAKVIAEAKIVANKDVDAANKG